MKIAILGGDGAVSARLSDVLHGAGHRALCVTGDNRDCINNALADADAVVDLVGPSRWPDARPCRIPIATAARLAPNAHYVVVSDIGAERLESSHFLAQRMREHQVAASSLAYTIVRMTLSFECVAALAERSLHSGVAQLPAICMQPIAAEGAALTLARIALGTPIHGVVELAGPEAIALAELAREVASAREIPLRIVTDAGTLYCGAALRPHALLPGAGALVSADTFGEWLRRSIPPG